MTDVLAGIVNILAGLALAALIYVKVALPVDRRIDRLERWALAKWKARHAD